jgi:hypothetical protein
MAHGLDLVETEQAAAPAEGRTLTSGALSKMAKVIGDEPAIGSSARRTDGIAEPALSTAETSAGSSLIKIPNPSPQGEGCTPSAARLCINFT